MNELQFVRKEMVSPGTVQSWLDEDRALVIDVREPHEFETERIAGAFLVSMSHFDASTFPRVPSLKTVLVSEYDARAFVLAERLYEQDFTDVYVLEGGLAAWRLAGFELEE